MINEKQKEVYTSPTTDVLELCVEGIICESTGTTDIKDWGDGNDFPIAF